MSLEKELLIEERIHRLLQHLGIQQAHFAARVPADWSGLASKYSHIATSMTLVCPSNIDSEFLQTVAPRLLIFSGDQGGAAIAVKRGVENLPDATLITFPNYSNAAWADVIADHRDEIASAMTALLTRFDDDQTPTAPNIPEMEGEFAGIVYRIRGSGPPLVLLPLGLAASQWEPILDGLSEQYCTITLGGSDLGFVAVLEARGRSPGYLGMIRNLMAEVQLQPGEAVLDVGCGSGVLDRWLVKQTGGANRVVGVDINRYLLREAEALAKGEGLAGSIEFKEGNSESLPFPDGDFDVVTSYTVLEEGDADQMLAELVRVTRPGGRIAVIVRAVDMPFLVNLPVRAELKSRVEAPGGNVEEQGCADASLYLRLWKAGLNQVKIYPQIAPFPSPYGVMGQFLQNRVLANLNVQEQEEWREAEAQAVAEGSFYFAWPHHCAVGKKL